MLNNEKYLNNIYIHWTINIYFLKNEGQEGKIGLFQGWVQWEGGRHKERVNMVDIFCIHI
jgi:hypothetical protein